MEFLTFDSYMKENKTNNIEITIDDENKIKLSHVNNNTYIIKFYKEKEEVTHNWYVNKYNFWRKTMSKIAETIEKNKNMIVIAKPIDFGFAQKYLEQYMENDNITTNYNDETYTYTLKHK